GRNFGRRNLLIVRTDHLVRLRQVDPELHAVKRSSGLLKFPRRLLGVDDATARRHPLNVARLQLSFVTLGVLVAEASGQHIGHRFKAAVRMIWSALGLSRPDVHWPHLVEQQEWIEIRQCSRRKWSVNQKTCAFQCRNAFDRMRDGTYS